MTETETCFTIKCRYKDDELWGQWGPHYYFSAEEAYEEICELRKNYKFNKMYDFKIVRVEYTSQEFDIEE